MKLNIIVIDNFYENPYTIREFALKQKYVNPLHQPRRSLPIDNSNISIFEKILSPFIKKIKHADYCFHYRISSEKKYIHFDDYDIAGIIFLNPDAPLNSGTSLYKKNETTNELFLISTISNIFNRLILFDSKQYHIQTNEFGNTIDNGRITQIYSFEVEL